jgi:hypothetical protein
LPVPSYFSKLEHTLLIAPLRAAKPKTNELRIVSDFRVLNKITVSNEFSISDVLETIESLGQQSFTISTSLDLLTAFY